MWRLRLILSVNSLFSNIVKQTVFFLYDSMKRAIHSSAKHLNRDGRPLKKQFLETKFWKVFFSELDTIPWHLYTKSVHVTIAMEKDDIW